MERKRMVQALAVVLFIATLFGGARMPRQFHTNEKNDVTTQIVVAGGGISGLTAALRAQAQGAEVVLVEKEEVLGGSARLSASGMVVVDSEHTPEGMDDGIEKTMKRIREYNETSERQPNYEFLERITAQTGETIDYIMDQTGIEGFFMDAGDGNYITVFFGGGMDLVDTLADSFSNLGGQTLLNTRAEKIVMENGKAAGLIVSDENGSYTIHADKVIMATGGASHDFEKMVEANPELKTIEFMEYAGAGNTGDGFRMLEEAGAWMGDGPYIKSGNVGTRLAVDPLMYSVADKLLVDAEGVRFANEAPIASTMTNSFLLKHASPHYYVIYDKTHTDEELLQEIMAHAQAGESAIAVYGKTIEELAENLDMEPETLKDSYERYQQFCAAGRDGDFGKDAVNLVAYDDSDGLYVVDVFATSWGTFGGAITDDGFHVLKEDRSIIGNLFAVGETASAEFFGDYYYGAFSLGLYATSGRIAAETAVAEIGREQ